MSVARLHVHIDVREQLLRLVVREPEVFDVDRTAYATNVSAAQIITTRGVCDRVQLCSCS